MAHRDQRRIGNIGNYYGGLVISEMSNGRVYWGIEDWGGIEWEEIPSYLVDTLVDFENQRKEEE